MEANLFAMLVYIISIILIFIPYVCFVSWLFPLLVVILIEKQSVFVKRHAAQIMAICIVSAAIQIIFEIIAFAIASTNPFSAFSGISFLSVLSIIIQLLLVALGVYGAVKAYRNEDYSAPIIGILGDNIGNGLIK